MKRVTKPNGFEKAEERGAVFIKFLIGYNLFIAEIIVGQK